MSGVSESSWVKELAQWLVSAASKPLPNDVGHIAARATIDSFGCAVAAVDDRACEAVFRVISALGAKDECTLIGTSARSSMLGAVLYNGSLIRALDCNDIFFDEGPTGHPSDNIAVALAVGEREHSSGADFLASIALGYEIFYRLLICARHHGAPSAFSWDEVTVSGIVGAAIAGLLMKLDVSQLADAMAIGGVHTYTLRQVRTGEISMLKASANAINAHTGLLAAMMAREGFTGPAEMLEGERGMLSAYEVSDRDAFYAELFAPLDKWQIHDISVKPYPSIGTSQAAIAATELLVKEHGIKADEVEHLELRLADLSTARRQIANPISDRPQTRESADHSLPFLVSMTLIDGEFGPDQYEGDPWLRDDVRALMARVEQLTDPALNANAKYGYPAVITITTKDGRTLRQEMPAVPGSPGRPFSDDEVKEKLLHLASKRYSTDRLETLFADVIGIGQVADVAEIVRQFA